MISGMNQEIDVLGKTFHFQTELYEQEGLSIRTEVFVGGKVVATREQRLEDGESVTEEDLRARLKEQHTKTIKSFIQRAKDYRSRGPEAPSCDELPDEVAEAEATALDAPSANGSPAAGAAASEAEAQLASNVAAPASEPPPITGEIASAIRIRRFFGRFRTLINPCAEVPNDLGDRLTATAKALTWMIRSDLFKDIRIDEQARSHLLKEQIDEWLITGRDRWRGAQIWQGVVTFSNYLSEVNNRTELVSFDQQTLIWALDEVQSQGISEHVLKPLESLYGRHPRLDQLIDAPQNVTDLTWTAHLRSVLTLL